MLSGFLSGIRDRLSRFGFAGRAARSWFELTAQEQQAILVILALFLLGMAVRFWHVHIRPSPPPPPPVAVAAPAEAGPGARAHRTRDVSHRR